MKKRSKRFKKLLDNSKSGEISKVKDVIELIQKNSNAKFDESIDVSTRINTKQSKSEINLRTIVNLPNGTGKKVRIAVVCEDSKFDEAKNSGADLVGSDELIKKISEGEIKFDKMISTPGMMIKVGKLGKILGPKGLMPNPKLGTVTNDLKSSIKSIKSGQIEIKNDKDGNISLSIGKKSFTSEKLLQNFKVLIDAVLKEKPVAAKGNFVLSVYLSSTMGNSYKIKSQDYTKL